MTDTEKKTNPYQDSGNIRFFSPDVPSDELEWHVDFEDRIITIIESGGWLFQRDEEIPVILTNGQKIFIPKETWHRVIKGTENLIIKVIKLD